MKFYRGDFIHPFDGSLLAWGTSKSEVRTKLAKMAANSGMELTADNHMIKEQEVGGTLRAFVDWLDIHFTSDNG